MIDSRNSLMMTRSKELREESDRGYNRLHESNSLKERMIHKIVITGDSHHLRKLCPRAVTTSETSSTVISMLYLTFEKELTDIDTSQEESRQCQRVTAVVSPRRHATRWISHVRVTDTTVGRSCPVTIPWIWIVSIPSEPPSACKFWFNEQDSKHEKTKLELCRGSETNGMEEIEKTLHTMTSRLINDCQ